MMLQLLASIAILAMIINGYSAFGQGNATMSCPQLEGNGTKCGAPPTSGPSILEENISVPTLDVQIENDSATCPS